MLRRGAKNGRNIVWPNVSCQEELVNNFELILSGEPPLELNLPKRELTYNLLAGYKAWSK